MMTFIQLTRVFTWVALLTSGPTCRVNSCNVATVAMVMQTAMLSSKGKPVSLRRYLQGYCEDSLQCTSTKDECVRFA